MAFRLTRLPATTSITDEQARPTLAFQRWWQTVMETIEAAINRIDELNAVMLAALVRLGAVEVKADGTATLAESAIKPGGEIKDDKVATTSMTANAATVITSFSHDYVFTPGVAGVYVDVDDGGDAARVSVETGPKTNQQVFIHAAIECVRAGSSNDTVRFQVVRDDGAVLTPTWSFDLTSDNFIQTLPFIDSDPAESTTHTYQLQMRSTSPSSKVLQTFLYGFLAKTG